MRNIHTKQEHAMNPFNRRHKSSFNFASNWTPIEKVIGAAVIGGAGLLLGAAVLHPEEFSEAMAAADASQEAQMREAIKLQGVKDIQFGSLNYMACAEGEQGREFKGKNVNNEEVKAVVCYAPFGMKGMTIRTPTRFNSF